MNMNDFASAFGLVVDILTLPTLAVAAWWYFGRRRRERKWLAQTKKQPGQNPAVLIVSLLPNADTSKDVEHYLASGGLSVQVSGDRIFKLCRNDRALSAEDTPQLVRELRGIHGQIIGSGCDVLHVFYSGPVVAGLHVGALLSNRGDVRLYHKSKSALDGTSGLYESWGPLNY